MTLRCDVERDVAGLARDGFNQPVTIVQRIHDGLACFSWPTTERLITADQKVMTLAVHEMIAPVNADLKELDRVLEVRDRRGTHLYPAMKVTSVIRLKTLLELTLEEVA